jgi:hypothetical protein
MSSRLMRSQIDRPRMVVLTFVATSRKPGLETVKRRFQLQPSEVDRSFGVRLISSDKNLYAVRVSSDAAARIKKSDKDAVAHADLRVRTLG